MGGKERERALWDMRQPGDQREVRNGGGGAGREGGRQRKAGSVGIGMRGQERGRPSSPGAKSFHMGSARVLNPPNGPAGKGLGSQFYKGGNGGSEAPGGAEPRKALKSAVRLPGDRLGTLGKRLALLKPLCPHLQNGNRNRMCLPGRSRILQEIMDHVKAWLKVRRV